MITGGRSDHEAASELHEANSGDAAVCNIEYRAMAFQGYMKRAVPAADPELTETGPGKPCGEYLRRVWQPVVMASRLKDLPIAVRIMGEDLVVFRDGSGTIGLLSRHCSHRGASLEYGVIRARGISCCYHGWHYACDGTVLEIPGEAPGSRIRERVVHGAYPTREHAGVVFAYMGPPGTAPDFPIYDTYGLPGVEAVPFHLTIPCNWLQVYENTQDPVHVLHLHAQATGVQFALSNAVRQLYDFMATPLGMINLQVRRMGGHAWVRTVECMLPNANQTGAIWEEAETEKVFQRVGITRWVVPVDDANTAILGWRWFGRDVDPRDQGDRARVGFGTIDFMGQGEPRDYEEIQRHPGDYEAQVSQRAIAVHGLENLASSDRGVAMLRQLLRQAIRRLARDARFDHPAAGDGIPTYTQDSVLPMPQSLPMGADDDETALMAFGRALAAAILDKEPVGQAARAARIRATAAHHVGGQRA